MNDKQFTVRAEVEVLVGSRRGDERLLADGMTPSALAVSEAENYMEDAIGGGGYEWSVEGYEVGRGEDPTPVRVRLLCTMYGASRADAGRAASEDLEAFLDAEVLSVSAEPLA